jgi:branched-chain amino acid transport system ATP-binding protein
VSPERLARQGLCAVPEGRAIFPNLTVAENLRVFSARLPLTTAAVEERTYARFPVLAQRRRQLAGRLSGGEQQMLGLGMAFLMRADLLLIDELSLGLSPAIVKRLLEAVAEVNRAGTTVILVEQSVEVALSVAGRAVVLEKGEVAFSGSAAELREHPEVLRSLFLASAGRGGGLLGAPARPELTETGRPEPVLRVEELTVRHGGIRAVDSVSLEAGRGEVVGLIGPNGAGKTTLFDAITGFATAERGRVVFAGRDVTRLSPTARARLGLVRSFQDARLFPSMTVRENLLTALERHSRAGSALTSALWLPSVRRQEVRLGRRADQLIELFELHGHEDRFVTELSTGVHRVVDLACVMAADPDILLLDEPSAGLSQAETEEMGPLLLRLRRETGLGLVVIEHDIKLITSISDHVVALDLGRVIAQGPPGDVIGDPSVVRSYLGAAAETAGGVG